MPVILSCPHGDFSCVTFALPSGFQRIHGQTRGRCQKEALSGTRVPDATPLTRLSIACSPSTSIHPKFLCPQKKFDVWICDAIRKGVSKRRRGNEKLWRSYLLNVNSRRVDGDDGSKLLNLRSHCESSTVNWFYFSFRKRSFRKERFLWRKNRRRYLLQVFRL